MGRQKHCSKAQLGPSHTSERWRLRASVTIFSVLAGLMFGSAAGAEGLGACVWSKEPLLHSAFLEAYHQGTGPALAFLSSNGPKLDPQISACAPGPQASKTWITRAIAAQAMQDGAAQELATLIDLDRATLEQAWLQAPKEVADCFRASAAGLFGISAPVCPEVTRMKILDLIGIPAAPRTPQTAHALNFFAAAAQIERADMLIDKSKVEAAAARPSDPGPLPFYTGSRTAALRLQHLSADQRRDVPFDREGPLVFQVKFGERDAWAYLDSGAQMSLLDTSLARDLNYQVFGLLGGAARGLGGSEIALRVVNDVAVLIPGQAQIQFSVMAGVDRIPTAPQSRKIEFVLGRDVLSKWAVMIDPSRRVFRFADSGSIQAPTGASVLDITSASVANVTINGKRLRMQIDTGFNGDMTLTPEAWQNLSATQVSTIQGVSIDGVEKTSRIGRIAEINLGSTVVRNVNATELSTPSDEWDGQIGLGILTRFQVAIDLGAGKLWLMTAPVPSLAPIQGPPSPPAASARAPSAG